MTHVALLRGINLAGRFRLPMKDLAAIFADAGATDVQTYIQSGNVVFRSSEPGRLAAAVTAQIAARFGFPGRIVLRSADEMRRAYAFQPFAGAPEQTLHVYFLADPPAESLVSMLDPDRSPGDSFAVHGREIYLRLPDGMGRTKLTNAYFDSKLATFSTARNWRTVATLVRMAEGAAEDIRNRSTPGKKLHSKNSRAMS